MQGRKYFCRIVLKTLVEGHLEEMENTESAAVELVDFLRRIITDICTEVGLRLTLTKRGPWKWEGGNQRLQSSSNNRKWILWKRPTLDTTLDNDESHFVTFYSYFGSHKLWLFTVIHKICLDTGGDIGGWKSQIVTFYSYFGYWGGYRRVVTICVNWGRCIYHVKSHYNPPAIICCRQQIHTEYSWWSVDIV